MNGSICRGADGYRTAPAEAGDALAWAVRVLDASGQGSITLRGRSATAAAALLLESSTSITVVLAKVFGTAGNTPPSGRMRSAKAQEDVAAAAFCTRCGAGIVTGLVAQDCLWVVDTVAAVVEAVAPKKRQEGERHAERAELRSP